MNIEQMTQKTREALQAAQRIAVEYSNNAVEQEHLLAALAQQQDGLIPQLLQTLGIDANAFAQAALQKVEALPRVTGSGRDPEKIYISEGLPLMFRIDGHLAGASSAKAGSAAPTLESVSAPASSSDNPCFILCLFFILVLLLLQKKKPAARCSGLG